MGFVSLDFTIRAPWRMGVVVGLRRVVGMAMFMAVGVTMLMAVVPQLGLVEQKEKHQTHQQGDEQLWGEAPDSKASGSKCMKAVASRAPAAKLSKCWV